MIYIDSISTPRQLYGKTVTDDDRYTTPQNKGKKMAFETIYEAMPDFVNLATYGDEDPCITPVGRLNVSPKMMDIPFFVITKMGSNPYYTDLFLSMPKNDQANFLHPIIGGRCSEISHIIFELT
ncbi:hypothetical protein ACJIZ3_000119 [Penstemon smallii]|uniref:Uncharacterized protein n=1 Tax=Penstemon smallii TaxID=265156 RepID=A0ABD3RGK6_9LAMI